MSWTQNIKESCLVPFGLPKIDATVVNWRAYRSYRICVSSFVPVCQCISLVSYYSNLSSGRFSKFHVIPIDGSSRLKTHADILFHYIDIAAHSIAFSFTWLDQIHVPWSKPFSNTYSFKSRETYVPTHHWWCHREFRDSSFWPTLTGNTPVWAQNCWSTWPMEVGWSTGNDCTLCSQTYQGLPDGSTLFWSTIHQVICVIFLFVKRKPKCYTINFRDSNKKGGF